MNADERYILFVDPSVPNGDRAAFFVVAVSCDGAQRIVGAWTRE